MSARFLTVPVILERHRQHRRDGGAGDGAGHRPRASSSPSCGCRPIRCCAVAAGYTWLFRGTPLILQLLLWFNLALIFPTIGIPGLWSGRAVDIMTPFLSALLGLGINQGAYTSEVMRAGHAIGRSPASTRRRRRSAWDG